MSVPLDSDSSGLVLPLTGTMPGRIVDVARGATANESSRRPVESFMYAMV